MADSRQCPTSVGNIYANLFSIAVVIYALFACKQAGESVINTTLVCLAVYALTLIVMEVLVLRTPFKPETGLTFAHYAPSPLRIMFKLVGLYSSYACVGFLYWLFSEYHGNITTDLQHAKFYTPYGVILDNVLPLLLIAAVPYTILLDGVMRDPEDRYYRVGRWLLLQKNSQLSMRIVSQHYLGWVIKGYFIALLSVYVNNAIGAMLNEDFSTVFDSLNRVYHFLFNSVLLIGLIIGVVGHALTLRVIDTHVRSVEPTLFGWWVCVFCFQPFKSVYDLYVVPRGSDDAWLLALSDVPFFAYLWGGTIMVLMVLTVFSDIQFGARYSYLTHRGIITNGLYKYTKHPSYVTVCMIYVLSFFPFFAFDGFSNIVSATLALALLSFIYFLRARTEERHLSHDPVYVEYALWMNEHGIFRSCVKWLPFIAYTAPKHGVRHQALRYEGME